MYCQISDPSNAKRPGFYQLTELKSYLAMCFPQRLKLSVIWKDFAINWYTKPRLLKTMGV